MQEIIVPSVTSSGAHSTLQEWLVAEGARVQAGDDIAVLETAKASYQVASERSGILQIVAAVGEECAQGTVIARVFESEEERQAFRSRQAADPVAPRSAVPRAQLDRRQAAIAEVVEASHREIPAVFMLVRVYCDRLFADIREWSRREKIYLGLSEALVKVVAGLAPEFPVCFGTDHAAPISNPNVGVSFDLGKGLFIPVVKRARDKTLLEIAKTIMQFRKQAEAGTFHVDELAGGHISITLNVEDDVVFAKPLIYPGQTCMISVAGVFEELYQARDKSVASRRYTNLGLAYDHRHINGSEAMRFMRTIKEKLEAGL